MEALLQGFPNMNVMSSLEKNGALEQLSQFLSQNLKGNALGEFKEALTVIGGGFSRNTPTIPINDLRGDEVARYSKEERLMRCHLASICRLIDLNGWTQSIYNHISARCPPGDHFVINPFGLLYHEVQASTLVKVNDAGNVIDSGSTVLGVNKANWTLHSALHSARSDANCVILMHLPDIVAVSCIKCGLLSTSPEATELLATFGVSYHDYQGMVMNDAEISSIRKDLGKTKILFLRNKGAVIVAQTIPEAWYLIKRLVIACQTQMRLLQLGGGGSLLCELSQKENELTGPQILSNHSNTVSRPFDNIIDDEVSENHDKPSVVNNGSHSIEACNGVNKRSSISSDVIWGTGEMEFEAQMRMLDSAGFRTGYLYRNPNLLRRQPTSMPWFGMDSGAATGADFFTTDMSCGEMSGIDEVNAATNAGATQMSKIADHVRIHKQRSVQRNQWLAKKSDADNAIVLPTCIPAEPDYRSTPNHGAIKLESSYSPLENVNINGHSVNGDQSFPTLDLTSTKSTPTKKKAKKNSKSKKREASKKKVIEFERQPSPTINTDNRCASLPASARNLVHTLPAGNQDTLDHNDVGAISDDEERFRSAVKTKPKWSSFRFPTFNKKKKRTDLE